MAGAVCSARSPARAACWRGRTGRRGVRSALGPGPPSPQVLPQGREHGERHPRRDGGEEQRRGEAGEGGPLRSGRVPDREGAVLPEGSLRPLRSDRAGRRRRGPARRDRTVLRGRPATSGESLGSAPRTGGLGLGAGTEEELRVPLAEEELVAEKRTRQAGEVRIRKDVVTERREIPVEVTREEVHVERTPVEGGEARGGEARFEGGTISVPVHEEEVEIRKRPGRPRGDPRRQDGAPRGAAGRRRGPAGDGGDREGGGRRVPRAREARGPARLAGAGRPRAGRGARAVSAPRVTVSRP